jgi:peptide/nickel transport system substrate-binding protein
MIRRLKHAVCAMALATGLALAFNATADADGGVLRIGREADSTSFDPIKTILNRDIWVMNNMNAFLVRSLDGVTLEPDLAESWEISDDGLVYTFHLRDAKFSDGTDVTAGDVVFSLTRLRDDPESVQGAMYQVVQSVEAVDGKTVKITLTEPSTPFLATLAMFAAAIVPEHAVTEMGADFASNPVGAGAFKMKEWERGVKIVLDKNEYYWEEGLPKLDGVEWYAIADDNTRILKVQAGELDAALFIPFNRVADLEADPDINVHLDPSTRQDHLLVNHSHPPLDNKNVRKALHMAVDQNAIVDVVTFGLGTPANSYIPAGALYYNPDNSMYPYDPDKAREMLAAEGVEDLELDYMVSAGDKVEEQTAILVKDQLAQVGVDVNIVKVDPSAAWDELVEGNYDLTVGYWTNDIIDPDQKSTFCLGMDSNLNYYTRYENTDVAQMVADGRVELDPEKRKQLYYDIQAIAKDDVNWIDLYYSPFRNISRSYVHGFEQNPLGRMMLEGVTMDPH